MTESSASSTQVDLSPYVIIQPPLSRCGHGPGLIIIRPLCYATCQRDNKTLDPEPLKKWAEESFTVAQITVDEKSVIDRSSVRELLQEAERGLIERLECDAKEKVGLIVYGSKKDYAPRFEDGLQGALTQGMALIAVVFFDSWDIPFFQSALFQLSSPMESKKEGQTIHIYSDVSSPSFIIPGHPDFKLSTAGIWDEHTYYEFEARSVEKTMATMVSEPYVNHVPTLTGGIGRAHLSHFYLHHFIFNNPDDTALELISRTVGTDRIVDEFIFVFTHVTQMDWMIPGIPPTGKHATVLVQLGLLPKYLPFPYALPDGSVPAHGKRFEYRVPAAGSESSAKLQNEHEVPSNQMFEYEIREVDD
ncbi:hypothetical protein PDIDSM_5329 [Penicillium digitatum]|nr:hypothetical protein PDIDSM_5329 [Penicillium digitatum]